MLLIGLGLAVLVLAMGGRRRSASIQVPISPFSPPPAGSITTVIPPPPPLPSQVIRIPPDEPIVPSGPLDAGVVPSGDAFDAERRVTLLTELRLASAGLLRAYQNRDPNGINRRPGSGCTNEELAVAIERARSENLPAFLENLTKTRDLRASAATTARRQEQGGEVHAVVTPDGNLALHEGPTSMGPPREVIHTSSAPAALPTRRRGVTLAAAHTLAMHVVDDLNRAGYRAYNRPLMRQFQRDVGLAPDGDYGPRSRQALGFYSRLPAGALPPAEY